MGLSNNLPIQIYVNVTTKCNLKCVHCYSNSGSCGENIDFNRLNELLNKVNPLRLMLSGGEPLLVIDDLKTLFSNLKRKPFCTLVTNGTIANYESMDFLENFIDEVVISLDTLDKNKFEKIRGVNCLENVLDNFEKFSQLRIKKRINFTIFDDNFEEFKRVIKFMLENKINNINLLRPRNVGRSSNKLCHEKFIDFYKKSIIICNNKKVNLSIHDPLINELNLEEFKTICYAGDKIISIDSDFNFKSCPFSEQSFSGDFFDILKSGKLKNNKLCCLK